MVPDGRTMQNIGTTGVAEYVKSEMTRECNLSQVGFNNKRFESTANLRATLQFQERIPHVNQNSTQ